LYAAHIPPLDVEPTVTKVPPPSPLPALFTLPPPLSVDEVEGCEPPRPVPVLTLVLSLPAPVWELPTPPHDATATTSAVTEQTEAHR
jgi:hypothetical protein